MSRTAEAAVPANAGDLVSRHCFRKRQFRVSRTATPYDILFRPRHREVTRTLREASGRPLEVGPLRRARRRVFPLRTVNPNPGICGSSRFKGPSLKLAREFESRRIRKRRRIPSASPRSVRDGRRKRDRRRGTLIRVRALFSGAPSAPPSPPPSPPAPRNARQDSFGYQARERTCKRGKRACVRT